MENINKVPQNKNIDIKEIGKNIDFDRIPTVEDKNKTKENKEVSLGTGVSLDEKNNVILNNTFLSLTSGNTDNKNESMYMQNIASKLINVGDKEKGKFIYKNISTEYPTLLFVLQNVLKYISLYVNGDKLMIKKGDNYGELKENDPIKTKLGLDDNVESKEINDDVLGKIGSLLKKGNSNDAQKNDRGRTAGELGLIVSYSTKIGN